MGSVSPTRSTRSTTRPSWAGCDDRIGDKRVLGLVKAFLKAGILGEDGARRDTITGTPQGGILSPLLANIALSVLDEHFVGPGTTAESRIRRRSQGLANYRSSGTRTTSWSWCRETVSTPRACARRWRRCSLRWACACRRKRQGSPTSTRASTSWAGASSATRSEARTKRYVYTYPSKKALASVVGKVRTITRQGTNLPLTALLHRLNPVLRGWTNYFRPGVVQQDLRLPEPLHVAPGHQLAAPQAPRAQLEGVPPAMPPFGWWPTEGQVTLFNPAAVSTTRYRYRGAAIPTPWSSAA